MTKAKTRKLDKQFSQIVKGLAGNKCEICSKDTYLNVHHYVGRRNRACRWYIPNGVCLCSGCHTMSLWSAHQNPEWFRGQIMERRGDIWLKDIWQQMNKTFKGTYEDVLEHYEDKTKNYV